MQRRHAPARNHVCGPFCVSGPGAAAPRRHAVSLLGQLVAEAKVVGQVQKRFHVMLVGPHLGLALTPNGVTDRSPNGGRSPTTTGRTPLGTASAASGSRRERRRFFCCSDCAVEAWHKRSRAQPSVPLLWEGRAPIPVSLMPREIRVPVGAPASARSYLPASSRLPSTGPAR